MKKILGLVIALVAVVGLLGTGTWAYFNDVQTVTNNVIKAGTLTMVVGGVPTIGHIDIGTVPGADGTTGIQPGDQEKAADWTISNNGTLNGILHFQLASYVNHENNWVSGGIEDRAGDNTSGANDGELGSLLKVAIWIDGDSSGNWDNSLDYYVSSNGSMVQYTGGETHTINTTTNVPDAAYHTLNSLSSVLTDTTLTSLTYKGGTHDSCKFVVEYYFPDTPGSPFTVNTDNVAQDDSVSFDLSFALVQDTHTAPTPR